MSLCHTEGEHRQVVVLLGTIAKSPFHISDDGGIVYPLIFKYLLFIWRKV